MSVTSIVASRVRQALRNWLRLGFRARACQGAPLQSNVIQSTRAIVKMPGRPQQGFPAFWGRACAPRAKAGAVIPWWRAAATCSKYWDYQDAQDPCYGAVEQICFSSPVRHFSGKPCFSRPQQPVMPIAGPPTKQGCSMPVGG